MKLNWVPCLSIAVISLTLNACEKRAVFQTEIAKMSVSGRSKTRALQSNPVQKQSEWDTLWIGKNTDIVLAHIDADPKPDLIWMLYDTSKSSGTQLIRYKIGWNQNEDRQVTHWSEVKTVGGLVSTGESASLAVADLNGNDRPELIFMAYGSPNGVHPFRYKIAYDLTEKGNAMYFSEPRHQTGIGEVGAGVTIQMAHLDLNSRPDLVLMAQDEAACGSAFRYKVFYNLDIIGKPASIGSVQTMPPHDEL